MPTATCDIGLIGLAVMGQNLVLNMNDHGYRVAVFNRTVSKVDEFLNNEAKGTPIVGAHSIPELVAALKTPDDVRNEILRALSDETRVEESIDAEVRKILGSYARPVPEGSPEWEILYQKTRDEVFRRRFRLA